MEKEYINWLSNKSFERSVFSLVPKNDKNIHSVRNALSRLFLSWHNFPKERKRIRERFLSDLTRKGCKNLSKVPQLTEAKGKVSLPPPEIWVIGGRATVKYGKFRSGIPNGRFRQWKDQGISDNEIVAMLLRYDSILSDNGNFWSLDPEICKILTESYGVTVEGFSSPLNNNFSTFCSLFQDVDAPFGSIGNFYKFIPSLVSTDWEENQRDPQELKIDQTGLHKCMVGSQEKIPKDLSDLSHLKTMSQVDKSENTLCINSVSSGNLLPKDLGEIWGKRMGFMVNPPYVDDIMDKTADKVLSLLDSHSNLTFFLYLPVWEECQATINLEKSRHLVEIFNLPKGKHRTYDHVKEAYIIAYFDAMILVLSSDPNPYGNVGRGPLESYISNFHPSLK